jgi:hypothetical protein
VKNNVPTMHYLRKGRSPIALMILGLILIVALLAACGVSGTEGLQVGDPAPAFTLPSASGEQVSLSDYQGSKPILLYFHMADG